MASPVELALRVVGDARSAINALDQTASRSQRMAKIGAAAGKALAVGLGAAAVGAFKLAQGAVEDEAAAAKLADTAKRVAGATAEQTAAMEDWISAQGKAYGIADDNLRPALDSLITATKDVGKAQEYAALAMDISTKRGLSLESVSKGLSKAITTGNVAALAKYGVAVKNADGSTKSLDQVTKALSKTYAGSAAAAAETTAGKWQRAQLQLSELGETIGAKLVPAFMKGAEWGLKTVEWVEQNQTTVAVLVGVLGGLLATTWAVSKAIAVWTAVTKIYTGVQWLLNAAMAANPITLVVIAVVALVAAIVVAYKRSETFRRIVDGAFRAVQKAAKFAFDWVKKNWPLLLTILLGPFGLALVAIIKNRDKIIAAIRGVIEWVKNNWSKIPLVAPIATAVRLIVENWGKIREGFKTVKEKLEEYAGNAKTAVVTAFEAMWAPIDTVISKVQSLIDWIKKIDFPDIDIPGVGRISAGSGAVNTGRPSGTGMLARGGDTYNIRFDGPLDDRVVDKLVRVLNDRQRSGRRGVLVVTGS